MKTLHQYRAWLILITLVMLGTACQSVNLMTVAETTEQKAYAAFGTYTIFSEIAADMVEQDIPTSMKLKIIEAEEKVSPVVNELLAAVGAVTEIREKLQQGQSSEERLLAALHNLKQWTDRLAPRLKDLVNAVNGVSL